MATNPIPGYTFENWLNGDPNIKWEDVGDFHGLFLDGEITKEEFQILEEEGNKIYSAQFEAFDKLVEYTTEVYKDRFKYELKKVNKNEVQAFKALEIQKVESTLIQDIEALQLVMQNEKDFDGLDGNTYKSILNIHSEWKQSKYVLAELFVNQNLKAFALHGYLTWLKAEEKIHLFLTLMNFFEGTSRDYNLIMEKLIKKKINREDKAGIVVREGEDYKWTYKNHGGLQYLAAFVFTLNEKGWLDLTDENGKPISNEKLANIITNTYGFKISKTDVAPIKNSTRPKDKYLLPFKDIPSRNVIY